MSRFFLSLSFSLLFIFSPLSYAGDPKNAKLSEFFKDKGTLVLPSKDKIPVYLALSRAQKIKGLSGIQEEDFPNGHGMFFYYDKSLDRYFWMPDTYFDLDIFFLDKKFVVKEIERNVPHHPGIEIPPPIPKTKEVYCRHILELPSTSRFAKSIKIGDKLKLKSNLSKKELNRKAKTDY